MLLRHHLAVLLLKLLPTLPVSTTVAEVREKFPERLIENAVKGMLPKNKLSPERMKRLRIFAGSEHAHTAQTPEKVEVK
jgi:large subunit ribosomal protein L13